jgi:arginase family enzyme
VTILLAPFSVGRHGVSQAPHTILGIRNGETFYHKRIAELPVHHHDAMVTAQNLEQSLAGKSNYLVLGGDHSITLGILRARAAEDLPVHLVMFDAHSDDYTDPLVEKVHPLHSGNWFKHAHEEGLCESVSWFSYRGEGSQGIPYDIDGHLHISVDLDVLKPEEIGWATPYPEVGGCSLARLIKDLNGLYDYGFTSVTADLVEYDPTRDHGQVGGQVASRLVTVLERLVSNTSES